MFWTRNETAACRVRQMLEDYDRCPPRLRSFGFLEFLGMDEEEYGAWTRHGLVSERWLRMSRIPDPAPGEWTRLPDAEAEPQT